MIHSTLGALLLATVLAPSPAAPPASIAQGAAPRPPAANTVPDEQAIACHGDPQCVVRVLEGRAQSPRALGELAVAYRQLNRRDDAVRTMRVYLSRFPTGPRAEAFRSYVNNE